MPHSASAGALVFPAYEHIVYLHPGDVIVFDGTAEWHANMVCPTAKDATNAFVSMGGLEKEAASGSNFQKAYRALQREMVEAVPVSGGWMQQQIECFYFQRMQRAYLIQNYNAEHPENPIEIPDEREVPLHFHNERLH